MITNISLAIALASSLMSMQGSPGSKQVVDIGSQQLPKEITRELEEKGKAAGRAVTDAKGLIDQGKYDLAIQVCQGALEELDTSSLRILLAEALLRSNRDMEALIVLRQLNETHFDDASYSRVGYILSKHGQFAESKARYSRDIVGRYFGSAKGSLAAIPSPRNVLELKAAWLLAIGVIEMIHGNDSDALYYYTKALPQLQNNPLLNKQIASILLRRGNTAEARRFLEVAAKHGTAEIKRHAERELAKLKGRPKSGD